jgi:signal transduction histidine kinase
MKTVNQLSATVAHEFRTPLAIIKGVSELLQMDGLDEEVKLNQLKKIPKQVERMNELVERLLSLQELKEIDYAAGMKILDIHTESKDQPGSND